MIDWRRLTVRAMVLLLIIVVPGSEAEIGRAAQYRGRAVVADEVLVRLRPEFSGSEIRRSLGADRCDPIGDGRWLRVRSNGDSVEAMVDRFAGRPELELVEPNYLVRIARVPNDPYFWSQWGFQNTGQTVNERTGIPGADIKAPQAWDLTTGSDFSIVGVLDTGIDYRHPDLAANMWRSPWSFPVTIGGVTRTCPEGAFGFDALGNDFDPLDDNDHGTHSAGTIGAVGDDDSGIAGVNWTTRLMALKFLDAAGNGTAADAINALEFAIQARLVLHYSGTVRILSNSWTVSGPSEALRQQIVRAGLNEMLFVTAAGNAGTNLDESPAYPQSHLTANMLNVAATDMSDVLSGFSNTGASSVHLGAPGSNVVSTVRDGGYAALDGTSMAAAHVAGTAALMLSVDRGLSVGQLRDGLLNGVDPQPSLAGKTLTGGRLNTYNSVAGLGPRLDFRIDLFSEPTVRVVQGERARFDVLVSTSQSYGGDVTVDFDGLAHGMTDEPQVIGGGGLVTVYVNTYADTPPGTYMLTLRGTGGKLLHTLTPTLEVVEAPDFTVSVTPERRRVKRGGATHFTVRVRSRPGFRRPISLAVAGVPENCTALLGRVRLTGSGRIPLVVHARPQAPIGGHTFQVTAESEVALRSEPVEITITRR